MRLIIDRLKWLRSEGSGVSKLLRSKDGKMCCLGFYCLAKGATEDMIRDIGGPVKSTELAAIVPELINKSDQYENSPICGDLMVLNDYSNRKDHSSAGAAATAQEQEQRITELFKMLGTDVEFIN